MESQTTVCKDENGEITDRLEVLWTYDVPKSTVFDELREQVEGNGEQRTITVVDMDGGQRYSASVDKSMSFTVLGPEGFVLYTDEECTIKHDGTIHRNEDVTFY